MVTYDLQRKKNIKETKKKNTNTKSKQDNIIKRRNRSQDVQGFGEEMEY